VAGRTCTRCGIAPNLASEPLFRYARGRLAGFARGGLLFACLRWGGAFASLGFDVGDKDKRFGPALQGALAAWGRLGSQGFTKVRSTEADHVGPASGRNAF